MGHVGPTFGDAIVSDHEVFNTWGVNGDTPAAMRIHPNPQESAQTLPDMWATGYTWTNLPSGTLSTFTVDCVYSDGDVRPGSFSVRTTGPPAPSPSAHAPSGLHVASYQHQPGSTTATLAWTNNDRYDKILLRWGAGLDSDSQTDLPGNATSRDVGGLVAGRTYAFQVKALQTANPHDYTAWATIRWQAPDSPFPPVFHGAGWGEVYSMAPPGSAMPGAITTASRFDQHLDLYWTTADGGVAARSWAG